VRVRRAAMHRAAHGAAGARALQTSARSWADAFFGLRPTTARVRRRTAARGRARGARAAAAAFAGRCARAGLLPGACTHHTHSAHTHNARTFHEPCAVAGAQNTARTAHTSSHSSRLCVCVIRSRAHPRRRCRAAATFSGRPWCVRAACMRAHVCVMCDVGRKASAVAARQRRRKRARLRAPRRGARTHARSTRPRGSTPQRRSSLLQLVLQSAVPVCASACCA
jgi:hypothetical protein